MNGPTLLLVNGEFPAPEITRFLATSSIRVLCTDGAANKAFEQGVTPDTIVGDCDSLAEREVPSSSLIQRTDQEKTDLEKTLEYCIEQEYTDLLIAGLLGERMDHSLSNLSVLARFAGNVRCRLFDQHGFAFVLPARKQEYQFSLLPRSTVSLIPLATIPELTTEGLIYPLLGEPLAFAQREGQSNVATDGSFTLSFHEGLLLVYVLSDSYHLEAVPAFPR